MRELLAKIRTEQRERWARGERIPVEEYLRRHPELRSDAEVAVDLIYSEILLREEYGETPQPAEYTARFPEYADSLREQFELHALLQAAPRRDLATPPGGPEGTAPGTGPPRTAHTLTMTSPPVAAAADGLPVIAGYETLDELDGGGQGKVYRARQLILDRVVALKKLHSGTHLVGPDGFARMQREARVAADLKHPHIVQVYDFGMDRGEPYFTMEYVEGGSLRDRLKRGPLVLHEAVGLIEKLARALEVVHAKGIVHRDLKPGNVLLTPDGEPKVADFGLAKDLDAEASLNPSGAIVGTIIYMAPEQAAGKNREVGPAADVWALGVILYEAVTGQRPFPFTDFVDALYRVGHQDPKSPRRLRPGLPRDVETICLKCLEKDPKKRYASALELAEDCAAFLANRPIKARPRPWYERAWRSARQHPGRIALAAVLLLGAAAAPFALDYFDPARPRREAQDPNRPRREAEATLAAGKPLVLKGDEPLPGPFRWVYGGSGPPWRNPNERAINVESVDKGLLELVADPKTNHYRFSAWVRHETAAGLSSVGLYFGYREWKNAQGSRRLTHYVLWFDDRGVTKEGKTSMFLNGELVVDMPNRVPIGGHVPFLASKPFPQAPMERLGPWRRLEVTIRPDGVEAGWHEVSRQPMELGRVATGQIGNAFRWHLDTLAKNAKLPEAATMPSVFHPRGGLGLYVWSGRAVFRDVKLEPLPVTK
jgi:serine/threonine protein kinase